MSQTYETEMNAISFIYGFVSSPGFKNGQELSLTERFQVKKLQGILEKMPEHVVTKDGRHLFGADIEKPIDDKTGMFFLKVNADGQPITTCRVKIPEQIITGLLWNRIFKATLERNLTQELAERIERWIPQFGLKDTFDKWVASMMPKDEPEEVKA